MNKISIKEFSIKRKSLSKILYLLNNYGIVKISNYLDKKKIKSLKRDTIDILNSLETNFIKRGIDIRTNTSLKAVKTFDKNISAEILCDGKVETITSEKLILA